MTRLLKTLSLAVMTLLCLNVQADPKVQYKEGDVVERFLSVSSKSIFSEGPLIEFPLPPGQWTVRHVASDMSSGANPMPRVRVWLDQIQNSKLLGLISLTVYEATPRVANWNPGASCSQTMVRFERGNGSHGGGCFSVGASSFMFIGRDPVLDKIRAIWSQAAIKHSNEALVMSGQYDKRNDGAVVYFQYGIPGDVIINDPINKDRLYFLTNPAEATHPSFTHKKNDVEDWLREYHNAILKQVLASPSKTVGSVAPQALLIDKLRSLEGAISPVETVANAQDNVAAKPADPPQPVAAQTKPAEPPQSLAAAPKPQEAREPSPSTRSEAKAPAALASLPATLPPSATGPLPPNAKRRALVIGNDLYTSVPRLENAREDARAMGQSLQALGFNVTLGLDLTEKRMREALRRFKSEVQGGDEVVVFYAGHGVQLGSTNYLLPTDIAGDNEDQVRDEAVQIQRILDDMQDRRTGFMLMIVDACRDNPFKGSGRAIGGRGLAPTTAASGQMVIFSAGAGQQALDRLGPSDKEKNGLFTRLFVKEMAKPGVTVDRVLRNVRTEVARLAKTVGHEQTPALYDQSLGDFYLKQ